MTQTMDGRVALVAGGGRGPGRAVALGLSAAGARVAVLARPAERARGAVGLAGGALAVPTDVTDPDQVAEAWRRVQGTWGPVEVVVDDAGVVGPLGPTATLDAGDPLP